MRHALRHSIVTLPVDAREVGRRRGRGEGVARRCRSECRGRLLLADLEEGPVVIGAGVMVRGRFIVFVAIFIADLLLRWCLYDVFLNGVFGYVSH